MKRLRLSTLMLLIIIAAMAMALVLQEMRAVDRERRMLLEGRRRRLAEKVVANLNTLLLQQKAKQLQTK
jgi:hypothetical protein